MITYTTLFQHIHIKDAIFLDESNDVVYCFSSDGHSFLMDIVTKEIEIFSWSLSSGVLTINYGVDPKYLLKITEEESIDGELSLNVFEVVRGKLSGGSPTRVKLIRKKTSKEALIREARTPSLAFIGNDELVRRGVVMVGSLLVLGSFLFFALP